ncbi:hypothetical protein OEV98_05415 [Caldibacillus lycopersici]|uniref:Flagellar protein n=1 Tax=Perspicuibacillus lycopersici TaxID=1325689 RepID=A0AAE3LSQ3_9BACI|nr:TIGR03826 family flagellar region protein [Perspicuibacillus lycopersici]MCU9612988.1 hypothetical protein [Perspicuibacillus lycopersici]
MNLANCEKCGELFVKIATRELCNNCFQEEEEAFKKVKEFLADKNNKSASLIEMSERTGVEEDLIYKFIRKGRIQVFNSPNITYPCENCGKEIRSGKLCEECLTEMKEGLAELAKVSNQKKVEGTFYSKG